MTSHDIDPRYADWPIQDRLAWEAAVTDSAADFLDDRPRFSAWAPRTQQNGRNTITGLIRWLKIRTARPIEGSIADVVTPDILLAYVAEQRAAFPMRTIVYRIFLIHAALELFDSSRDWAWITQIMKGVRARARREIPAARPIVHASVLYDLGVRMMEESAGGEEIDPSTYRGGLAVALLAAAPMRISNFAAIEIGRQLCCEAATWIISLTADETKTRRMDVWPIAEHLNRYLEHYLAVVRPALLRRARHTVEPAQLWIGDRGRPIGDQILRRIIATATREHLGVKIDPHSFRHCAATTFALERPLDGLQSSALLGHASPQTTEKHYIIQQRQLVQQGYLGLLQQRGR
jgi:integrase